MERRLFLKGSIAGGAITSAIGAGLLSVKDAMAEWPKATMKAKDLIGALGSAGKGEASDKIKLKAPEIAENGAVVPIDVDATGLEGVTNITLLVESNPSPMAASFEIAEGTAGFAATRVKMGKSGNAIAVVVAGGKTYHAQKEVKVTIGGCGG